MVKPDLLVRRYLHAVYCDDVRSELGNKFSLMGVYQGDLLVPEVPTKLPKLCVSFTARTMEEEPFQYLKFELVRDSGPVLVSVEVPPSLLAQAVRLQKRVVEGDKDPWFLELGFVLQISPLEIDGEFLIRSRVETETEVVRGPGLLIKKGIPAPIPPVTSG